MINSEKNNGKLSKEAEFQLKDKVSQLESENEKLLEEVARNKQYLSENYEYLEKEK